MSSASSISRALLAAGLILAVSAIVAWLTPTYLEPDTGRRLMAALFGAMFVMYANAIPKAVTARSRCAPAVGQAARRFTGWVLVIGGLGYIAVALLAPVERIGMLGGLVLGTSMTVAALGLRRIARGHAGS